MISIHLEITTRQNQGLKSQWAKIFLLPQEEEPEPEPEQETSFRIESHRIRLERGFERLYKKLSKKYELPKERHSDLFKIQDGELYYRGLNKPLTYDNGRLRSIGAIEKILHKERLCKLGFIVPRGEVSAREAVMLNRAGKELPSASDIAKTDDIELQEIVKSMEDLITHFEGQEMLPMCELLGLDKQLRSIRGSLKVEVAKRFSWEKASRKRSTSSRNSEAIPECTMMAFEKTS